MFQTSVFATSASRRYPLDPRRRFHSASAAPSSIPLCRPRPRHCVWDRTGQTAKSIPERSSARLWSDSSRQRRRGSRCRQWGRKWRENERKRGRRNIQQRHDQWWNDFLRQQTNRQALSQMCDHVWRASVRWGVAHTVHRVHGSCHCLDAQLPERTKNWEVRKTTNGDWIQVNLTMAETLSLWLYVHVTLYHSSLKIVALSLLSLIPPFFVLPPLRVPALSMLVPRWRTPPRWACSPCRGSRWWEIRRPIETQPLKVLLNCWIQCVILSFFATLLECEVLLWLELVEGWQEHLLMIL